MIDKRLADLMDYSIRGDGDDFWRRRELMVDYKSPTQWSEPEQLTYMDLYVSWRGGYGQREVPPNG